MKIKTSGLTGWQLDYAVAKSLGFRIENDHQYTDEEVLDGWWQCGPNHWQPLRAYSTDWSQAGPIIESEGITLKHYGEDFNSPWSAWDGDGYSHAVGPTPLIAAMRCFVASKLGEEIEFRGEENV